MEQKFSSSCPISLTVSMHVVCSPLKYVMYYVCNPTPSTHFMMAGLTGALAETACIIMVSNRFQEARHVRYRVVRFQAIVFISAGSNL